LYLNFHKIKVSTKEVSSTVLSLLPSSKGVRRDFPYVPHTFPKYSFRFVGISPLSFGCFPNIVLNSFVFFLFSFCIHVPHIVQTTIYVFLVPSVGASIYLVLSRNRKLVDELIHIRSCALFDQYFFSSAFISVNYFGFGRSLPFSGYPYFPYRSGTFPILVYFPF